MAHVLREIKVVRVVLVREATSRGKHSLLFSSHRTRTRFLERKKSKNKNETKKHHFGQKSKENKCWCYCFVGHSKSFLVERGTTVMPCCSYNEINAFCNGFISNLLWMKCTQNCWNWSLKFTFYRKKWKVHITFKHSCHVSVIGIASTP